MQSRRVGLAICAALLLVAALAPAVFAGQTAGPLSPVAPVGPSAAGTKLFLPMIGPRPSTFAIHFWAERYALPADGCTTLHWRVEGAQSVFLDGEGVTGTGMRVVCPLATQFYTLEVTDQSGAVTYREVVLTEGDQFLAPDEVIAQAVVSGLTPAADVDPAQPGAQPGYSLQMSGINVLFKGQPAWNEATVTLGVPQELIDFAPFGPVDWPVQVGKAVEFRATCDGPACFVSATTNSYLYLRSE